MYGSAGDRLVARDGPLRPSHPYSASRARLLDDAQDVGPHHPVVEQLGPYQYPEKVLPLFVTNASDDQPWPPYGDGRNVRDWPYVLDNCAAIDLVLRDGREGEVDNVGGSHEVENVALTHEILRLTGKPESFIRPVTERLGHDRRNSLDSSKMRTLGWTAPLWLRRCAGGDGALVARGRALVTADQSRRLPRLLRARVRRAGLSRGGVLRFTEHYLSLHRFSTLTEECRISDEFPSVQHRMDDRATRLSRATRARAEAPAGA